MPDSMRPPQSEAPLALPRTPEELRREHSRTRLLALSFDMPSSPSITLQALAGKKRGMRGMPYGWGFAWYGDHSNAAQVVKDPSSIGDNAMTKVLREWERFESSLFVCHLRGAARLLKEHDTHPFVRSHGGRDWVFAHNGDLVGDLNALMPLNPDGVFEPIGKTDSERAFCWLLDRARSVGARSLVDIGWNRLHGWLRELDLHGTANFLFTDGVDIVAYHDDQRYNGLYWARMLPPHAPRLSADDIVVDLGDAGDRHRTSVAFCTVPLDGATWTPMEGGQMLVVRRGAFVYDSFGTPQGDTTWIAPFSSSGPAPYQPPRMDPISVQSQASTASASPDTSQSQAQSQPMPAAAPGQGAAPAPGQSAQLEPTPGVSGLHTSPATLTSAGNTQAPTAQGVTTRAAQLPAPHPSRFRKNTRMLALLHETRYRYDKPVERSSHIYRLRPVHDQAQSVIRHQLSISSKDLLRNYEDVFGNASTRTEVETPYTDMRILARSIVRIKVPSAEAILSPEKRFRLPLVWMPWQRQIMHPYLLPPELPESQLAELYDYALAFAERQDFDLVQTLLDINTTIYRDYNYVSGSTTLETTPFDVYVTRKGVCQDFANLFICLARLLSIPARYRVGYIWTGANYENKIQSEASHAWLELYLPWCGWVGMDPTNGCLAGLDHIRVACGRNYRDATPTSGTIYKGGGFETLSIDVRVEELVAPPRDPLAESELEDDE